MVHRVTMRWPPTKWLSTMHSSTSHYDRHQVTCKHNPSDSSDVSIYSQFEVNKVTSLVYIVTPTVVWSDYVKPLYVIWSHFIFSSPWGHFTPTTSHYTHTISHFTRKQSHYTISIGERHIWRLRWGATDVISVAAVTGIATQRVLVVVWEHGERSPQKPRKRVRDVSI